MHARDQVNLNPYVCQCRRQTARVGGKPGGLEDLCPPAGSRGGAPVGSGGFAPRSWEKISKVVTHIIANSYKNTSVIIYSVVQKK